MADFGRIGAENIAAGQARLDSPADRPSEEAWHRRTDEPSTGLPLRQAQGEARAPSLPKHESVEVGPLFCRVLLGVPRADRPGAAFDLRRLGAASGLAKQGSVVFQCFGHVGVVRPQRQLEDC